MRILHLGDDFAALRPCGLTLYSEALMEAQAAAGHDVSYLFSGRHYPRLAQPRLKRWRQRGVRMIELIGPPIHSHWELGTLRPALDLGEPAGEAAFAAAVRDARPEVIHIHELARLPSSLIEHARGLGIPVAMTLHDYKPVCASVRLLDADERRCTRREVGEDCARNCAGANDGPGHLIALTLDYEAARAKRALHVENVDFSRAAPLVGGARRLLVRGRGAEPAAAPAAAAPGAPPQEYQLRREVNVARLNMCDRLVAPSPRVAEIYTELGVDAGRLRVQRLTLPHLQHLKPARPAAPGAPLTFVTLGAGASPSKGSRVLVEAVQALERQGYGGRYRLVVHGHVEDAAREALEGVASVELAGPYAPADLASLLDDGDVGIVPSIWEETHGFVGIEMLAKGLPLIGNALGGIPEYVRDGVTGWLNRSATGAELASLMAAAVDDPGGVQRLRESVRARRDELVRPMADHTAEVEALYAELTADQAAAISSPAARRAGS